MKTIRSLLLVPTFALAGSLSGTVLDLAGKPVIGASIRAGKDSTLSGSEGSWIMEHTGLRPARSSIGPAPRSALAVVDGRLRLHWTRTTPSGRHIESIPVTNSRDPLGARQAATPAPDTLQIHWKGKRLVVIPIGSSDSGNIVVRIDTAWAGDNGFPWNPRVTYGSFHDPRDNYTYRTIRFGDRTLLAENLQYRICGVSYWQYADSTQGLPFGQFYQPGSVERGKSCNSGILDTICPRGWYPSFPWNELIAKAGGEAVAGRIFRSIGWAGGVDSLGLRILPGGFRRIYGVHLWTNTGAIWTGGIRYGNGTSQATSELQVVSGTTDAVKFDTEIAEGSFNARCQRIDPSVP